MPRPESPTVNRRGDHVAGQRNPTKEVKPSATGDEWYPAEGGGSEILDDMLNPHCVPALLAVLGLTACGQGHPAKSAGQPTTVTVDATADATLATQQLAQAQQLVADKNWPEAIKTLQAIIDARSFSGLSGDVQYQVLANAGRVNLNHGSPKLAREYFVRVTSTPQADFEDWLGRMRAADKSADAADSVSCLTVLMQRWPDRTKQFNADYILDVTIKAKQLPHAVRLSLLRALYDAHWKLKWDTEPSACWRDLALLSLEKGQVADAIEVSAHVQDAYVLIAMRADRRFDAVVLANPPLFDIDAAAERQLRGFQLASEQTPRSLALKSSTIGVLLQQQRYAAALAASDAVLMDIRSTNYPAKLYEDYEEVKSEFFNLRADALWRAGRWDEAVAQLTAASQLDEHLQGNVSQLIDLGVLYCALGRPKDALAAIGNVIANTSAYGAMQLEAVRLDAADQLGDSKQVERSLQYLQKHRADAPITYVNALVTVNQLERAARTLIAQLIDQDQRQEALQSVQGYALPAAAPRAMDLESRWRAVVARPDVQAAIQKVGRVESYRLEEP